MRVFLSLLFFGFLSVAQALSSTGSRLLVVLEEASEKATYSQFWADLEARGFKLSFESHKNEKLSLFKHGALAYDHVILTPPKSKGYGPSLTPKLLLEFTNAGGNVLLTLSDAGTPSAISSLLLELDIHISPDRTSVVVDHFSYDVSSASEQHDTLLLRRPISLRSDVKNFFGGTGLVAVPKAVGQALGNTSPLLAPILKASDTAYIYSPKEDGDSAEDPFATGTQISLVSTMQARNSARFTVLGSLEMLADKWFDAKIKTIDGGSGKTVNRDFAKQITAWTFKEVGVLKAGEGTHYETTPYNKEGENSTQVGFKNPTIYRIKNDVTFTIPISEWETDHWTPYTVPESDSVQLEFSMLSPFYRLPLTATSTTKDSTLYSASFKLPDQHGIFAFKVNYKRPFLTPIDTKQQVTVRHFAHDEWPRSWQITGAWPWIAGLWSVIGGFVAFVAIWLYCEPPAEASGRLRSMSQGKKG